MRVMTTTQTIPTIFPLQRNPYYFVSPRYVRTSAGIKGLYLLCHWLNRLGECAFIYTWPENLQKTVQPDLLTPVVTRAVIDHHISEGRSPIFVYTDVATENIANADVIVRYFGHYPGHLAPRVKLADEELHFSHSLQIAEKTDAPDNVIYIPVCDPSVFHPPENPSARKGTCYYAAKYKDVHGRKIFGIPANSLEITRDTKDDLTPAQLGDLFRRSELLYLFEDSAIGNEATMCGCPVVLVPNDHFMMPVGFNEVGHDGIAWGLDAAEIERAKSTVGLSFQNYLKLINDFPSSVSSFVEKTQFYASTRKQSRLLIAPEENYYLHKKNYKTNNTRSNPVRSKSLKRKFEFFPIIGSHFKRVRRLRQKLSDISAEKDDLSRELTLLNMEVSGLRTFARTARHMIDSYLDWGSVLATQETPSGASEDGDFIDFLTDEINRLRALRDILQQARNGGQTMMVSYRGPGMPISVSVELPPTLTTSPHPFRRPRPIPLKAQLTPDRSTDGGTDQQHPDPKKKA
jgi:hypothetical protein